MIPRIRSSNGHGSTVAAGKQGDADDVAVMTNDEGIRGHVVFVTSILLSLLPSFWLLSFLLIIVFDYDYNY